MLSHGMVFNLGSARGCSPAINETYFSYDKDILNAVTDYYMYFLLNCVISICSYTSIKKLYTFIV